MFKLLVVDDEPIHRRELANLIRTLRDGYEVCEADNGKDALELISRCEDFNILVTDVKMPLMDGLELIEAMGERIDKVKVVVLSGYDYFDYAKRALKLGACDYLLKPVDEDAVRTMLEKVEKLIEKQVKLDRVKNELQQQLDKTYPMYIDYTMNRLISGEAGEEEAKILEDMIKKDGHGRMFALYLYGSGDLNTDIAEGCGQDSLKAFLRYTVHSLLKSFGHSLSFFLNGQQMITAGILKPANEEDAAYLLRLENEFYKLSEIIRQSYPVNIRIGVGNSHGCLYEAYRAAAKEAMDALDFGFYSKAPVVFYSSHQTEALSRIFLKTGVPEALLKEAIGRHDRNKAGECFEAVTAGTLQGKPLPSMVKSYVKELLSTGLNLTVVYADKSFLDEINNRIKHLSLCGDFCMLIRNAEEILEQMIQINQEMVKNKNRASVTQCLKYISEHLTEDISVDMLASRFHFNNSYFSTIFKKSTGVGLSEYIVEARMKKALQLLKNSDTKVYEVALKVGFRDVKYFCKAFKNKFGVTPNHFRRYANVGSAVE